MPFYHVKLKADRPALAGLIAISGNPPFPAQDNIRIIPSHASLRRVNRHFSQDEDVFDVMHYDDLWHCIRLGVYA